MTLDVKSMLWKIAGVQKSQNQLDQSGTPLRRGRCSLELQGTRARAGEVVRRLPVSSYVKPQRSQTEHSRPV